MCDIDLINYIPYEIRKIEEYQEIVKSENPEFCNLDGTFKGILDETFISTATETGLSRFEKMLGIVPNVDDTLDDRRFRILTRWNNEIPYTWRVLIQKLVGVCGAGNFEIELIHNEYLIKLTTRLVSMIEREELRVMLDTIIPCNMVVDYYNELLRDANVILYRGMGIMEKKKYIVESTF